MEDFYKELHIPIILLSGLRVPHCKGAVIKSKFGSILYEIYIIFTDLVVILSVITIGWGAVMPGQKTVDRFSTCIALLSTLMSFLKVIYCFFNPGNFDSVFKLWNNSFNDDPYFIDLVKRVEKGKLRTWKITTFVFTLVTPPAMIWGLLPYIPAVQKLHNGKFTVLAAWFPFDIKTSPNFELAVLFQTLGAIYVTSKNVAFDSISYNHLSRLTTQIQHLQVALKEIFSIVNISQDGELKIDEYTDNEPLNDLNQLKRNVNVNSDYRELSRRLRIWIRHHQHTIKIVNELNKLYSFPFALLLLHEIGTICLIGFTVLALDIDDFQYITVSAFAFGNILVLFVVCSMGDILKDQSNHILDLGFSTNWYVCPKAVHSSLKVIFQRGRLPFNLLGLGVYPVSSETFISIMKSVYSYIMVLNQLKIKGHI